MESLIKTREEWLVKEELELLMQMTLEMEVELKQALQNSEES